ncbi:hypothetical protein J6590_007678 [Homalodisca vitripennis]|nr:hypothetical protein J6590_007678 [Homalodisca vitripennis]
MVAKNKEPLNLSDYLTDSLSLQINATAPTRSIFPLTPEDPYLKLRSQDPMVILGERSFGSPKEISEDTIGTPIQEFYRGVDVFITGATGFIGKILTEKLIRSIPHLGHIYLLIRSKREKTSEERFSELLQDKAYIHVSTAFSQCVKRVVEETVPMMSIDYKKIINYIESKTDDELLKHTPRLLQGWVNTYVFSKAMCESMIQEEYGSLPICVFRPSIVLSTYKEPVRGYIDNLYGPVGLLVGTGHGIIHCSLMSMENNMESVPVDYAVNCMIATAWRTSMNRNSTLTSVYNFTTTPIKPILWKHLVEFALHDRDLWPFSRAIWYSSFIPTDSPLVHEILYWILQRIPGIFLDKVIQLAGGEPILGKIYGRIYNLTEHTGYYARRNWEFKNDNVMSLWRDLTPEDKQLFNFDLRDVDMREHLLVGKLGIRYYYLKEEMENIPACIRRNNYLRWLHRTTKAAFGLVVLKLLVVTARALPF